MLGRLVPLITIAGLNAVIGLFVLLKDTRRAPNRSFAFFAFSISAWTLAVALTHNVSAGSTLLTRTAFAAATLMVFSLLFLIRTFPDEHTLRWHWTFSSLALAASLLTMLSFTPLLVSSASLTQSGLQVRYGPLYPIFALYIYSSFGLSVLLLAKKYRASTGLVRLQFNYLLLGLLVPGLGVTITNLLVPLLLGTSRTGQYGPYFAVVFLAFTAHALIHYRFMDIRLILRRSVTFLLGTLVSAGVLALVLGSVWAFGLIHPQPADILLIILTTVALSAVFPVLRDRFGRLLDRYVYRSDLNYPRALHETSQALVSILDLDDLAAYAARTTQSALRADTVSIYVSRGDHFQLQHHTRGPLSDTSQVPGTLTRDSAIIDFLVSHREPLVTEELRQRYSLPLNPILSTELTRAKWGLVLPIHSQNMLEGVLAVGPKLSGDPFFPNDLEFLEILANQVGVALRNAELYKAVVIANESLGNILATIDSGVIAVDAQRRVSLFNHAAERISGVSAATMRDQPADKLPAPLAAELDATLSAGYPRLQLETSLTDHLGRSTPILSSTTPLRDRAGVLLGAVTVFSDLSRLKELEGEKRRAERLAAFGAFASGIAHEIKNPLVAIRTFAELIPDRFSDEEFRKDFAGVVLKEIDRIDQLVARLRGLVVPSHSSFRPLDLTEPLEETLTLLRGQFLQRRIRLHRHYHAAYTHIQGDPDQLKQLFLNILVNAVDALENDGEIQITTRDIASHEGPRISVAFTDSGPGIPETLLGRVFDPFVTTKPTGSGLGLAICRGIADAHKATIRAVSNVDSRGTSIIVEFPVTREVASADAVKGR